MGGLKEVVEVRWRCDLNPAVSGGFVGECHSRDYLVVKEEVVGKRRLVVWQVVLLNDPDPASEKVPLAWEHEMVGSDVSLLGLIVVETASGVA